MAAIVAGMLGMSAGSPIPLAPNGPASPSKEAGISERFGIEAGFHLYIGKDAARCRRIKLHISREEIINYINIGAFGAFCGLVSKHRNERKNHKECKECAENSFFHYVGCLSPDSA